MQWARHEPITFARLMYPTIFCGFLRSTTGRRPILFSSIFHGVEDTFVLTEIINERSKNRPALLFDRIKDYQQGYRVAANLVSSSNAWH